MLRIGLGILLGALALSCAPTSKTIQEGTVTVQGRAVYHNVSGDVKEVTPGHWTGPWKSVGVSIDDIGQPGEEAMPWVEEGVIDMVWKSPTELVSCTNKSTQTSTHRGGGITVATNTATCRLGPDGKLVFEGKGRQSSGTGRFVDTQFTSSWTSPTSSRRGPATSATRSTRPH